MIAGTPPELRVQTAGYDASGPLLGTISAPATAVAGQPVTLSVSPFDVWSAPGPTTWTFGDGTTAPGTAVTHAFAAGAFTVGVEATDAVGNATRATRPSAVAPAPKPAAAPAISRLRVSPATFRAARRGPTVKPASAGGPARVSYTLSRRARVRFVVERARGGRRVGGRCVVSTKANRRRHRVCTRYVALGSFSRERPAGSDRFTFTGRVHGRTLAPGRHRLAATPAVGETVRASLRGKR